MNAFALHKQASMPGAMCPFPGQQINQSADPPPATEMDDIAEIAAAGGAAGHFGGGSGVAEIRDQSDGFFGFAPVGENERLGRRIGGCMQDRGSIVRRWTSLRSAEVLRKRGQGW